MGLESESCNDTQNLKKKNMIGADEGEDMSYI